MPVFKLGKAPQSCNSGEPDTLNPLFCKLSKWVVVNNSALFATVKLEPVDFRFSSPCRLGSAVPPNPSELLGSTKMKTLLHALGNAYDYVILDSPAVLAATDAAVLSVLADGTLVTALAGKSRKTHLSQAVEQLREVNANLMGVILNGLSAKSDSYGMYYREASSSYNVNASAPKRGWFGRSRDKQKKAAPKAKTVTAGKSAD